MLVAAIRREDRIIIPRGTDVILPGDDVYLTAPTDEIGKVLATCGIRVQPVNRVAIFGGSKVGRFLAADLCARGIKPKLFEPDPRLARWLAEQLPQVVVVQATRPTPSCCKRRTSARCRRWWPAGGTRRST